MFMNCHHSSISIQTVTPIQIYSRIQQSLMSDKILTTNRVKYILHFVINALENLCSRCAHLIFHFVDKIKLQIFFDSGIIIHSCTNLEHTIRRTFPF
ncbi:hypothetical protein BpHYR1_041854 [Brachionus plicatilis]|uniref:Uncharacterized protein n=1 Tax=Brachionus plicatilis TaxID=10195 RepID=A0A3M7Q3U9_BRAPC|nr:hypothetical protein BpHYR1_041854 [Brachionus plicatilis]